MTFSHGAYEAKRYATAEMGRKVEIADEIHRHPESLVLLKAKDGKGDFAMLMRRGDWWEVVEDSLDPEGFERNR